MNLLCSFLFTTTVLLASVGVGVDARTGFIPTWYPPYFTSIVDACNDSEMKAGMGFCKWELVSSQSRSHAGGPKHCAEGALCRFPVSKCGRVPVITAHVTDSCSGFYSVQHLGGSKFRFILLGRLEKRAGFVMMKFSTKGPLPAPESRPADPFLLCWAEPKSNGTGSELGSDGKGINVDNTKTDLRNEGPWLICTFEISPSPEFPYDKEDEGFYDMLARSRNSTDWEGRVWAMASDEKDKVMKLMMDAATDTCRPGSCEVTTTYIGGGAGAGNRKGGGGGGSSLGVWGTIGVIILAIGAVMLRVWMIRACRSACGRGPSSSLTV